MSGKNHWGEDLKDECHCIRCDTMRKRDGYPRLGYPGCERQTDKACYCPPCVDERNDPRSGLPALRYPKVCVYVSQPPLKAATLEKPRGYWWAKTFLTSGLFDLWLWKHVRDHKEMNYDMLKQKDTGSEITSFLSTACIMVGILMVIASISIVIDNSITTPAESNAPQEHPNSTLTTPPTTEFVTPPSTEKQETKFGRDARKLFETRWGNRFTVTGIDAPATSWGDIHQATLLFMPENVACFMPASVSGWAYEGAPPTPYLNFKEAQCENEAFQNKVRSGQL